MGSNLRDIFMKHLPIMRQHPTLDVDAVIANPNMTLYEFDTLVSSVCGGFVSSLLI